MSKRPNTVSSDQPAKKPKTEEKKVETDGKDEKVGWAGEVGVIVHWGVYSVPAYDSVASAKRRSTQNGSEWYLKRLTVKPDAFRPCSGLRETQAWHKAKYGSLSYGDFGKSFTASAWQPDEWMQLFKGAGATYAILTAKHHDGICLWPTDAPNCPTVGRDILGEFKTAALKAGLKFGIYYSWGEFLRPATKPYMDTVVKTQIDELIGYAPSLFWFDGDWMCTTNHCQKVMDDCLRSIKKMIPKVLINDRIGHKEERKSKGDNHVHPLASYRVYADRAIPKIKPTVPWEHVNTIGYSWGYNAQQTAADYKSPNQIKALYEEVKALGGRFLINVGPKPDGSLDPAEANILRSLKLA